MNRLTLKLLKSRPLSLVYRTAKFGHSNTWVGVFSSWAAALAAIPAGNQIGYNQQEAKAIFSKYPTTFVRPGDYPILLHLRNIAKAGMRLIDVGGSIGMAYYIALKYFPLPESFEWGIFDVPAVLEAAQEVALREGEKSKALRFVPSLAESGPRDIFFTSGSLQLIEDSLADMLEQLPDLPQHVLITRIPVWDRKAIFTLNDMGFSLAPYKIFNRQEFVQSVEQLGYKLVDEWTCPESNFFSIRFRPGSKIKAYRGFYFTRNS
jgi:putative methyltransferase (TIGR04325 family)